MKKKTIAQLQKEAALAPKWVMYTNEFGNDIYIADEEKTNGCPITDKASEALQFAEGYDNKEMKLSFWCALTGYKLKAVSL